MIQTRMKQRHIAEETWIALKEGTISNEEFMQILEHTCDCTWCAEQLAAAMEQGNDCQEMPAYLPEQIQERVRQLDVRTFFTIRNTSRRIQLLLYSLKVGAGVACSILILIFTVSLQNIGFMQAEYPGTEQGQASERRGSTQIQEEALDADKNPEETILDVFNEITYGATEKMNEFANIILNGGKKE